jgi:hypothetical protein
MKANCWEVKKCGREPGGKNVSSPGVCPATSDTRLDGVHGGRNSGRACWMVKSTLCGGQVQGSFGDKFKNCQECDFYKKVRADEGASYVPSVLLLSRIRIELMHDRPRVTASSRSAWAITGTIRETAMTRNLRNTE